MKKILVIEDLQALRRDIIDILSYEGFEVAEAEDGARGVEVARRMLPDLIICDIMMPELNGYQVLDILRKDEATAMIPFIFLTAKTDKTDIRFGMMSGADDYLTKPFKTAELLATIRTRLERSEKIASLTDKKLDSIRANIITALPHELRTPLNTIIGFSEMLMMDGTAGTSGNQTVQWAQHINEAAQRLSRLIENYIAYARVETMVRNKSQNQPRESLTANPSVPIEFQVMQKGAEYRREADLVIDLAPIAGLQIMEDDLRKLVMELVDNAFKFSTTGTKVEVTGTVDGANYTILIRDQGRGMTPEMIASVGSFMQFERWLYEQQGTGLGLSIARRLAEIYAGALEIDSVPQQGTTVKVRLPMSAV